MATTTAVTSSTPGTKPSTDSDVTTRDADRRPSALRRTGVALATVIASAPPVVWGLGTAVEMITGQERDHLFHQIIGQGLLLSALWLAALWPLTRAGWRGRRPSTAAGLHTVAFTAATLVAAALAPQNGGGFVSTFVLVTVGLLWLAIPRRPRLRGITTGIDPVAAPVVALLAALHVHFAIAEAALQRAMGDEHAAMSHNYDMALVSLALVLLGVAGAVVPAARRLLLWTMLGSVAVGASRFLITGDTWWSLAVAGLGVIGAVAAVLTTRRADAR